MPKQRSIDRERFLVAPSLCHPPQFHTHTQSHASVCSLADRCFAVAFAGKENLENGDKILLPPAALDHLARLAVTYPMMFEIKNPLTQQLTHCGVMEFSAEEGKCYVPYWMMENLNVENGGLINLRNVTLPKGSFVQLRPHKTQFTKLSNPRVVLEKALRSFSCLTQGNTIRIAHGDTKYDLDIVEVRPSTAISIIETDVNVDFAPPKDFEVEEAKRKKREQEEKERKQKAEPQTPTASSASSPSSAGSPADRGRAARANYFAKLGSGHSLSGKKKARGSTSGSSSPPPVYNGQDADTDREQEKKPAGPRFNYQYSKVSKPGQKRRLLKRTAATDSKFKAFGGAGNSLK